MPYHVSEGFSFLEKNEMGCHCPLMYCWSTAPIAESEASVARLRSASGVRAARAFLMPVKAWVEVSSQVRCSVVEVRSELSGSRIFAQPGIKLMRPRNVCSWRRDLGCGKSTMVCTFDGRGEYRHSLLNGEHRMHQIRIFVN